jgi:nucleoside-diphosphate-sugar epimerase
MILVTGGTGFEGSHLMKRLASERIQTRCLARKTSDIHFCLQKGWENNE